MPAKAMVGIGGAVVALGLLILFVVVPSMSTPLAYGANIGAGVLVLFSFVLLGAGLLAAATGAAFWIRDSRRKGR